MFCCETLREWVDEGALHYGAKDRINDGRIMNEIDTEYFIRAPSSRGYSYIGMNYCPFCGRALSLGLWAAEKKK
jgi:hypothetical protein